jgi:hypothetical protein
VSTPARRSSPRCGRRAARSSSVRSPLVLPETSRALTTTTDHRDEGQGTWHDCAHCGCRDACRRRGTEGEALILAIFTALSPGLLVIACMFCVLNIVCFCYVYQEFEFPIVARISASVSGPGLIPTSRSIPRTTLQQAGSTELQGHSLCNTPAHGSGPIQHCSYCT